MKRKTIIRKVEDVLEVVEGLPRAGFTDEVKRTIKPWVDTWIRLPLEEVLEMLKEGDPR